MSSTEKQSVGATLDILVPLTSLYYSAYGVIGFTWKWDTFDQGLLAFTLLNLGPCLWRDARALHQNCVVRPREIAWAVECHGRRARRAAAQAYLRENRDAR